MPTVSTVRGVFQKAIDERLGDLNMTAVINRSPCRTTHSVRTRLSK
jgi:hypothetical protein